MLKIGKGKNGRQRMASWISEYPPSWGNGEIVFIIDKLNQSTGESSFHKFFKEQRVPPENMKRHLGLQEWQSLPDGATEWFYCDTFIKNTFRSAGIDLVQLYKGKTNAEPPRDISSFEVWLYSTVYTVNKFFRKLLGISSLLITTVIAISLWGSWATFIIFTLLGLYISLLIFPRP
tara:strand:- start:55 stop:582 length:528 start_codon:yes stop_codon:yes gene_type:complete